MTDIFHVVSDMRRRPEPFAVATVVETEGSVSAKTSAKAVITHTGQVIAGWVGGGCAESAVCATALECIRDGSSKIIELDMNDEVLGTGMPCGGSMRVYVEPVLAPPTLWILGHGLVAECLCHLGAVTGFRVVVLDPMLPQERYPDAAKLITDDLDYSALEPLADDYVVIATQHKGDHQSLRRVLSLDVRYIALVASTKRARLVMEFLKEEGFGDEELARVRAPSGIDLGCRTPEEIALSVLAEIVMTRRGASGALMREKLVGPGKTDKK